MADYKSFRKEKWLYLLLSIAAYFLPFITVTACLFPLMTDTEGGLKFAIGFGIVVINAIPFLMGVFKTVFAHFPMLNMLAIVFVLLAAFFTLDAFSDYVDYFIWIELSAAVGSLASCLFWAKHKKYKAYAASVKANIKSGAFKREES